MQTRGLGSCPRINRQQRLGRTQLACYLYICNGLSGACEPGNSYRGRERYIMRLLRLKSLFGRHSTRIGLYGAKTDVAYSRANLYWIFTAHPSLVTLANARSFIARRAYSARNEWKPVTPYIDRVTY